MIQILEDAYQNPNRKFCFFNGLNHKKVGKALGLVQWDWNPQPTVDVEPWYWNTHTLALAFGCNPTFTSEGDEWIEPLITNPDQIKNLPTPNVRKGRTGQILKKMETLIKELPEDTLVRLPDVQSPLGVAELIMGESLYMSLITHPNELHLLLSKISDFIVSYIDEIKKICGNRLNAACHPKIWSDNKGYYISDDTNSMVSPEMHKEFSVDYINRITENCGPVLYHSCTWTNKYIENMRKINNKKIVNWSTGTSMDPAKLIKENAGKVLICPHIGKGMHAESAITSLNRGINTEFDLIKYYLDNMQDNSTLCMSLHENLLEDIDLMKNIYQLFDDYGYSPQKNGF